MAVNLHTHTYRCGHASGTPEQYIKRAIKNGIKIMGFSEHAPCASLEEVSRFRLPCAQIKDYFNELNALREKYKDDIEIYIGFEMEYYPERFEEMYTLAKQNGADYLILGQHFTKNEHPDGVYVGITPKPAKVLTDYVNSVIDGIKKGVFTYICHPDVIVYTEDDVFYEKEITRLCEVAKEYDIPLEINFYGIRDNRFYPFDKFWEIAGKVGCSAVYGFDAHDTASAYDGASISAADALVRKYGLKLCESPKIVQLH